MIGHPDPDLIHISDEHCQDVIGQFLWDPSLSIPAVEPSPLPPPSYAADFSLSVASAHGPTESSLDASSLRFTRPSSSGLVESPLIQSSVSVALYCKDDTGWIAYLYELCPEPLADFMMCHQDIVEELQYTGETLAGASERACLSQKFRGEYPFIILVREMYRQDRLADVEKVLMTRSDGAVCHLDGIVRGSDQG